jgi:predicted CoA-substrate-specific enzyme activase
MKFIGFDVGSVSVKLVVFDEKANKLSSFYERHKGHPFSVAFELLRSVTDSESHRVKEPSRHSTISSLHHFSLSITGSAGRLIASVLGIEPVNEIVAQTYSIHKLFPHIKTIIEMGGEDSKLIILERDGRSIGDFSMNSVCAAGTGSFLDQQAERLRLTIEEFSELALRSKKPSRIAGRCSVFAKSDMIHLQQIATPVEDIVAGLCFAVARNFKGSILRGRKIRPPVSFQGGVAANKGMVRAFKEIFKLDELFVPEEYAFMGAIGAVLKNMHAGTVNHFDLSRLEDFLRSERPIEAGHPPLNDPFQSTVNSQQSIVKTNVTVPVESVSEQALKTDTESDSLLITRQSSLKIKTYLGIDIGSISTNLAVIDEHGRLLSKRYLMTAGRPIEAVRQGLAEIGEEIGGKVEILGVGTTGSGRYMIADYVGADIVKNEITAHATAAVFIDKTVDTVFEIGGQDSKYISLKDGVVVDFEMNKACAAGTGSFLEEQAEKLNISIKGEFAQSALSSKSPSRLGERCTVFMENSLMANLQKGIDKNDLLAGLAYSIVQNYINRVVAGKNIGENIFFLGGVAFNKAVMAAFEKYLGKRITVPLHHEVAGAIGMALIAMRHMKDRNALSVIRDQLNNPSHTDYASRITSFKGFELSKRPYEISSFECKSCPNSCDINRIKITGEEGFLFYGGRCEKYDVKRNKCPLDSQSAIHDLFSFRDEMLWKEHMLRTKRRHGETVDGRTAEDKSISPSPRVSQSPSQARIGLPYIFYLHDYLPFWTTLLWELGFDIEVSPKTNRQIVNLGLESVLSETCFPAKVAHGHIKYLFDKNVDALLLPSFINLNTPENPFDSGYACPYTQTIPYLSKIAFEGIKLLTPIVNQRRGKDFLEKEIKRVLRPLGVKSKDISRALEIAERKQEEFLRDIKSKGKEALSSIKDRTIVIVGRAYNAFDSGVNLEIPKKLADLGVHSIPMDFLPIEEISIHQDWPNMYWRSGQRILQAAKLIRNHPNLFAIYIGNFSCGPDSFILKFFDNEMKGKPYLFIEIDEHSAAAGAITRCEAFIDSINNKVTSYKLQVTSKGEIMPSRHLSSVTRHSKRTLYIPRMSDHAFALAAAFEQSGIESEVLPESDKQSADIGRQYVSGRECYPCTVTTGDMVKKVMEHGFVSSKSAFFMPSATGPCRFGQYNVFQRLVLDKLGCEDVPIFAPTQDTTFYSDLGIVGKEFTKNAWKGILAYELLNKCLHETRPYEKDKGSADELYEEYLRRLYFSLKRNNVELEDILKEVRRDFENLPVYKDKKTLIGIIGEIFVRCHRFSNEDLIRKVEALGGEVWLAPVEEWIYYVNFMGLKKAWLKKEKSAIISFLLKRFYQKRVEHRYARHFEGFLKTLKEPDTKEILKKASPYIHSSFEGEAILSIGKCIDLLQRGASGIINAMPFGCMPGTIVTALLRGVSRDYEFPCMNIPYDGTESATIEIQLEAFMDQAKQMKNLK